jgi:hypothetical protein
MRKQPYFTDGIRVLFLIRGLQVLEQYRYFIVRMARWKTQTTKIAGYEQ